MGEDAMMRKNLSERFFGNALEGKGKTVGFGPSRLDIIWNDFSRRMPNIMCQSSDVRLLASGKWQWGRKRHRLALSQEIMTVFMFLMSFSKQDGKLQAQSILPRLRWKSRRVGKSTFLLEAGRSIISKR
jgi:hypothetical protein